jgi:hypothetical protein
LGSAPIRRRTRSLTSCPPLSTNELYFRRLSTNENEQEDRGKLLEAKAMPGKDWRRGSESNRRIKVLQTSPLPLGYRAPVLLFGVRPKKFTCREAGDNFWSGRRDLNPRLRPWQGRTLPLSYSRSINNLNPKARIDVPVCRISWRRHSGLPG